MATKKVAAQPAPAQAPAPVPAPAPAPATAAVVVAARAPKPKHYTNLEVPPAVARVGTLVTFRIHYQTGYGDSICVVGGPAALGAWNASRAFSLIFTPGSFWEGSIFLPLSCPTTIEYKFGSGGERWESGSNRVLELNPNKYSSVTADDQWHSGDGAQYSSAFSRVIHGRPNRRRTAEEEAAAAEAPVSVTAAAKPSSEKRCARPVVEIRLRGTRIDSSRYYCIVGSHPSLGAWDEKKAIVMDDSRFPLWSTTVELGVCEPSAASTPIRYKYGVWDPSQQRVLTWEEGADRELPPPISLEPGHVYLRTDESFRYPVGNWKGAGVATPVFSLRTAAGLGVGEFLDLCPFVDWARSVGLRLVQILPINDTVSTHTWVDSYPYGSISVFALHPIYIRLEEMGRLRDPAAMEEFAKARERLNALDAVDYDEVMRLKSRYFKLLFDQERAAIIADPAFHAFVEENKEWLHPYAAFSCLRDRFGSVDYSWWPQYGSWASAKAVFESLMTVEASASHPKEYDDLAVHLFIQYHAHLQMSRAAQHARSHGVVLKGDLPIGVMRASVDTWVDPQLFNLQYQTGAPPDAFSANGQNWGFPTYNWDAMAADGYSWWKRRLGKMSAYFDAYRIDHILGFFRIWEIPGDAVDGLLGQFSPAHPLSRDDLRSRGLSWFDYDRLCKPYIREHFLHKFLGSSENVAAAKREYLSEYAPGCYNLKPLFGSQKAIQEHFAGVIERAPEKDRQRLRTLRDGLMGLVTEVVFLPARVGHDCYTPRVTMQFTQSFMELDGETKNALNRIYTHYFYERQEGLWNDQAWRKLPALKSATDMLVCGEDLGMVPACVPPTMAQLGILSLNVQRMPKDPKEKFFHPSRAPYMSVVTPSSHDTSTIRGWWEEDGAVARDFWIDQMGRRHTDPVPVYAEPWLVSEIVNQHMYSPAMWAIFPLQDLLGMDGQLRLENPHAERINVPANPKHYWRFRFHLSIEQLAAAKSFNDLLKGLITNSGRNAAY